MSKRMVDMEQVRAADRRVARVRKRNPNVRMPTEADLQPVAASQRQRGRPGLSAEGPSTLLSIRLSPAMAQALDAYITREGGKRPIARTKGEIVRFVLEKWLQQEGLL